MRTKYFLIKLSDTTEGQNAVQCLRSNEQNVHKTQAVPLILCTVHMLDQLLF